MQIIPGAESCCADLSFLGKFDVTRHPGSQERTEPKQQVYARIKGTVSPELYVVFVEEQLTTVVNS
jgi:hypothetical protein